MFNTDIGEKVNYYLKATDNIHLSINETDSFILLKGFNNLADILSKIEQIFSRYILLESFRRIYKITRLISKSKLSWLNPGVPVTVFGDY